MHVSFAFLLLLAVTHNVFAGFDNGPKANMAVYWGQNSAGQADSHESTRHKTILLFLHRSLFRKPNMVPLRPCRWLRFDFEDPVEYIPVFTGRLRKLFHLEKEKEKDMGRRWLFSAVPQYLYPDTVMQGITDNVFLDLLLVQFYNNACGVHAFIPDTDSQPHYNFG
ncbi:glycoside hydrolase family 18 protein [Amniculicola lignicola CBS 123094]|uniref:Glycoside hydrolase family 18 protein n=1 Tax=Amniculicola lignicola CBS 123094 TaxID=1392246 RepID=A0A6A5VY34_9PLEO|nr:glycoside hydrolase family 18 protein [Amniculicola lignicola CBS 123094]